MVATTVAASLSLDLLDQTEPRHWWGITLLNSSWKYSMLLSLHLLIDLHCPWQWSAEQSAWWRCRVWQSRRARGGGGAGTGTSCTCKKTKHLPIYPFSIHPVKPWYDEISILILWTFSHLSLLLSAPIGSWWSMWIRGESELRRGSRASCNQMVKERKWRFGKGVEHDQR